MPWLDLAGEAAGEGEVNGCLEGACALAEEETALWRPLVLLIPLRLGLSDINEAYIETLKVRNLHSQELYSPLYYRCCRGKEMQVIFEISSEILITFCTYFCFQIYCLF